VRNDHLLVPLSIEEFEILRRSEADVRAAGGSLRDCMLVVPHDVQCWNRLVNAIFEIGFSYPELPSGEPSSQFVRLDDVAGRVVLAGIAAGLDN